MAEVIPCKGRVPGTATGALLTTRQPLSLWGGVDPEKGVINDPRHELFGESMAGKVLAFPYGKGSTGAPLVVMELARLKNAPAALVLIEVDPLVVSGPVISKYFYGETMPVVTVDKEGFQMLKTGTHAKVDATKGEIRISDP